MNVLPDVLLPNLAIVFCGSAAGAVSARRQAYYAGPGNAFWPTLFEVGLTPRLLMPGEYACVTEFGLGLTDLAKTVSGSDRTLSARDFDPEGLRAKIVAFRPRLLAFTSKRSASEFLGHGVDYGLARENVGETSLFILPSPSGAARRYWNREVWHELARLRFDLWPEAARLPPCR